MRCFLSLLVSAVVLGDQLVAQVASFSPSQSSGDAVLGSSTGRLAFVNTVADAGGEIFAINPDGTNRTRLSFNMISEDLGADITPDGSVVAFSFFNNIYVMNSDGTNVRQLTFTNNNSYAAISPDGTKVAFTSNRNNNTDIYLIHADGTNFKRITTNQFQDSNASFSPDGTRLLFHTNRNGQYGLPNLYVINADGTNETRLTYFFEFDGRFSPDGTKITYMGRTVAGQNNFAEIFVMDADGTNPLQLTQLQSSNIAQGTPSFSLDGSKIAFSKDVPVPGVGNRNQIFVMNADGSGVEQVTFYGDDPLNPSTWVPKWISMGVSCAPSDSDCDGDLDLGDFETFQQCFSPGVPAQPECQHFDRSGDGAVDLSDFAVLADELSGP